MKVFIISSQDGASWILPQEGGCNLLLAANSETFYFSLYIHYEWTQQIAKAFSYHLYNYGMG